MFQRHQFLLPCATLALAAATACSNEAETSSVSTQLRPTHADPALAGAIVTIDRIYLQSEIDGAVVLRDEPATVDLVDLAETSILLVNDVPVPAGEYHQLRFVISGGYIAVEGEDGSERLYATVDYPYAPREPDGELRMPSFDSSGLKVQLDGQALAFDNDEEIVVIDFDVAESFGHQAGRSDAWVMHPVLRASAIELSMGVDLVIRVPDGLLLAARDVLTDVWADLHDNNGNVVATSKVSDLGDGTFVAEFDFVDARQGPFTVGLTNAAIATTPSLPLVIGPNPGATTRVEVTILSL